MTKRTKLTKTKCDVVNEFAAELKARFPDIEKNYHFDRFHSSYIFGDPLEDSYLIELPPPPSAEATTSPSEPPAGRTGFFARLLGY